MLAISRLLMAALHPHFSSAFQAVRKGRTKWQEVFGSELWPFVSEMETLPRDFVYTSWPEKHLMAPTAIWDGERGHQEMRYFCFPASMVALHREEWGQEGLLRTYCVCSLPELVLISYDWIYQIRPFYLTSFPRCKDQRKTVSWAWMGIIIPRWVWEAKILA